MPASTLPKPKVFIGSSRAGLGVAEAIQFHLQGVAMVNIWNQGLFPLGAFTLEKLLDSCAAYDFAILVLTDSDILVGETRVEQAPSYNVMFELGLFMSYLGRSRTFVVRSPGLVLPEDLAGVTVEACEVAARAGEQRSAAGPACTLIREAIGDLGFFDKDTRRDLLRGKIGEPADGAKVEHEQILRGSAFLGRDFELYIAVRPMSLNVYFPQVLEGPIALAEGREWASYALIGLREEVGRLFFLHLFAADAHARECLDYYEQAGKITKNWTGFERRLPSGCTLLDTIEVERK